MTFDDGNLPALARLAKHSLPARTSSRSLADGASARLLRSVSRRQGSFSRLDTRHDDEEIARTTANESRGRTAISTRTARDGYSRKRGCYPEAG